MCEGPGGKYLKLEGPSRSVGMAHTTASGMHTVSTGACWLLGFDACAKDTPIFIFNRRDLRYVGVLYNLLSGQSKGGGAEVYGGPKLKEFRYTALFGVGYTNHRNKRSQ